jgi:MFS transporter, DHA2 family, multidrug resistance protein
MDPSVKLSGWHLVAFTISIGFAHVLVLLNAGAYIAMLPRIAGGLSIPPSLATWTQTDYMISLALGFPVGNWLSRRRGEYRPFIGAMSLFAVASIVCAYCDSLPGYLAARIVLGFAGGITLPIGQSLFIKEFPENNRVTAIGFWNLFTLIPFTFGPLLGGWLADNWGWRWLFKLNIPAALAVNVMTGVLLCGRRHQSIPRRFDAVGFALAALTLLGFQTWLNQGNDWDWSNSPNLLVILTLSWAGLVYFIVWELSLKHPFLDIRLFAHRNFAIGASIMFVGFLFFQGLLSLLIVQLQLSLGYSSLLAALVFLPMAILAKPVGGLLYLVSKIFDARLLASLNLLGFAIVYFWLSRFDQSADYAQLFWPKVLEGLCLGSFFLPLTMLLLHGLPAERQWRAVELAGMLRIAAGAIGITFQGIVLYQRTPFHLSRITEQQHILVDNVWPALGAWASYGIPDSTLTIHLLRILRLQARLASINEAFWFAGWIFVILAATVWLAKPTIEAAKLSSRQAIRRDKLLLLTEEE